MKRIFGTLGRVALGVAPLFGPLGSIASSVAGGLLKVPVSGLPGILTGLTVGVGGNFVVGFLAGFGLSFYLSNHEFRSGINEAIGAVLEAIKGVIF